MWDVCLRFVYLGKRIRMRIKVHQAAFASQPVVPSILQVGNLKICISSMYFAEASMASMAQSHLHVVTNALHMAGGVGGLWPKNGCHSDVQ